MISDETYAVDVRSSGTLSIASSSRHNHKSNGFYLVLVDILDIILVLDQHLERWCLDRLVGVGSSCIPYFGFLCICILHYLISISNIEL
jgi:hypothetical protein